MITKKQLKDGHIMRVNSTRGVKTMTWSPNSGSYCVTKYTPEEPTITTVINRTKFKDAKAMFIAFEI